MTAIPPVRFETTISASKRTHTYALDRAATSTGIIYSKGRITHSMPFTCHAVPLRVKMCLSHLIYTVRPCLIHTCHAMPCTDHAVLLKATAQHGRRETAVLCSGLEKNGKVGAWHGKCESDTAALCKSNGKDTF